MNGEKKVSVITHVANPIGGGDTLKTEVGFTLVDDPKPKDPDYVFVKKGGVMSDVKKENVIPQE